MNTDQTNKGIWSILKQPRIFKQVVIKFTAPKIDEIPAKCNEKIAISTDDPLWLIKPDKGG